MEKEKEEEPEDEDEDEKVKEKEKSDKQEMSDNESTDEPSDIDSNTNPKTKQTGVKSAESGKLKVYKAAVRPWWMGQQLIVETEKGTKINGRIKDYFTETKQVQTWHDNPDSTFENVRSSDLSGWTVFDALKIHDYAKNETLCKGKCKINDFIPDGKENKLMLIDAELFERVSMLHRDDEWYTAFIDGYDEISR